MDDDAIAGVVEAGAQQHGHEDPDKCRVEDEVAGFAQVAAFGGYRPGSRAVVAGGAVSAASQLALGDRDGLGDVGFGGAIIDELQIVGGIADHALQPGRGLRRRRAERFRMMLDPRDDAADEGDEQQQVDGREPGRAVDVEQLQFVDGGGELGVVVEVLHDAVGVGLALWEERAGDRGNRHEQEQDERGAHARELPPPPSEPALPPEADVAAAAFGGVDVIAWACGEGIVLRAGAGHSPSPPAGRT